MADNAPMEVDSPSTKQPRFQVKKVRSFLLQLLVLLYPLTDTNLPIFGAVTMTVERRLLVVLGHCC